MADPTVVAVFGSSRLEEGSKEYQQAYALGYQLAKKGFRIINGGGPGIMQATAAGVKAGGGQVLAAIIPGESWSKPNTLSDLVIECGDLFSRIRELYIRSAVFIVMKGGTGTLAELGIVWNLLSLETSQQRCLFLMGDGWEEIMAVLEDNLMITENEKKVIRIVHEPEQLLQVLEHPNFMAQP